jgi:hypothetical protein
MTSLNKASLAKEPDYHTRPPFQIKKEITSYALKCSLVSSTFCLFIKLDNCELLQQEYVKQLL